MRLPCRFRRISMSAVGFVLLASADPERLRRWYSEVLGLDPDGEDGIVIDGRDDVEPSNPEAGRATLRIYVAGAPPGVLATMVDPDGNRVQLFGADDPGPAA